MEASQAQESNDVSTETAHDVSMETATLEVAPPAPTTTPSSDPSRVDSVKRKQEDNGGKDSQETIELPTKKTKIDPTEAKEELGHGEVKMVSEETAAPAAADDQGPGPSLKTAPTAAPTDFPTPISTQNAAAAENEVTKSEDSTLLAPNDDEAIKKPVSTSGPSSHENGDKIVDGSASVKNDKNDADEMDVEMKDASMATKETIQEQTFVEQDPHGKLEGDVVEHYIKLEPLASRPRPLKALSNAELVELEKLFGIDKGINQWDDDWVGVVALTEEDVPNPDAKSGEKSKSKPLVTWAEKGKKSLKLLFNLVRHVYNHRKTPKQAKKILGNADPTSFKSLMDAIGRLSLDPLVLRQDGWTTTKADKPEGASGGAYRIGEKVIWQGYVGVVIAFVHDPHIGDLFKAMWTEDFSTFDLETEELEDARRKYDRKHQQKLQSKERKGPKDAGTLDSRRSIRTASTADFHVKGIEHGIVLATSYAKGARHGVFWPARVMHATEVKGSQSKRNNRQKVDVVFLAPYWNSNPLAAAGRRTEAFSDSIARHGDSLFRSGPLFEFESIDANEESIQMYPYTVDSGLDIDELRSSFKFSGLPKAVFARFLDSHRLALALKTYSQNEMKSTSASDIDRASADLLEGHPLSAMTANFPEAVLHLPFDHILSQLPHPEQEISPLASFQDVNEKEEPALQLGRILDSMKPPMSWGLGESMVSSTMKDSPRGLNNSTPLSFEVSNGSQEDPYDMNRFLAGLSSLHSLLAASSTISIMLKTITDALLRAAPMSAIVDLQDEEKKTKVSSSNYRNWIVVKVRIGGFSCSTISRI